MDISSDRKEGAYDLNKILQHSRLIRPVERERDIRWPLKIHTEATSSVDQSIVNRQSIWRRVCIWA